MQPNNNSFPKAALDAFAEKKDLRIKIESIHDEQQEDTLLRRFKDKWLFLVTLRFILGAFIGLTLFVVFRSDSPQAGMAINGGMSLVIALAGYYVRGKNN